MRLRSEKVLIGLILTWEEGELILRSIEQGNLSSEDLSDLDLYTDIVRKLKEAMHIE